MLALSVISPRKVHTNPVQDVSEPQSQHEAFPSPSRPESKEKRRERRLRQRHERIAASNAQTDQLLAAGDEMGLFDLHQPIIRYHSWRLQQEFEFDDFTRDDLNQVGRCGLWKAIETFDPGRGANFHTHATRCVIRYMWKEWKRLSGQQKLGFRQASDFRMSVTEYEKPQYVDQLAETELIGAVYKQMECITDRARMVLCRCVRDGEKSRQVARDEGASESSISRTMKTATAQLRDEVQPMLLGSWHQCPWFQIDTWELLRDAQENHSKAVPVEEQNLCKMCGADLPRKKMNFCNRNCAQRYNYAKKREADKSAA